MRQLAIILALLLVPGLALADALGHPFAARPGGLALSEDSRLLQWGPSTLGYSQAWFGGESRSQGYLLKELHAQLHPTLSFRARFGLSFQPGALGGTAEAAPRFELPEAVLTWRPGEDTVIRLQFQQGGLWSEPAWRRGRPSHDPFYDSYWGLEAAP